ncbi:MAG: hypothetical protein PVJ67_02490 [Candidatus Pacearchaeota archaeon]|jgi:hypothetical protein
MKNNRLTYRERREFLKYGLVAIASIGAAVSGISSAGIKDWAKKENEKLNKESYKKLIKIVCGEKNIDVIPSRGWQFYAQEKLNENPWLNNYTNPRELGEFYKTFNGGVEPSIKNRIIKEPLFKNPKTGICEKRE